MGKLSVIALVVLLLPVLSFGNDISLVYTDSLTPADSGTIRVDTVYSGRLSGQYYINLEGNRYLQFGTRMSAFESFDDTNFTNDTFFFNLQSSFDGLLWTTHAIDTAVANAAQNSTVILDADATVYGNFLRLMAIHTDSIGVGEADSALVNRATPYKKLIQLFVIER